VVPIPIAFDPSLAKGLFIFIPDLKMKLIKPQKPKSTFGLNSKILTQPCLFSTEIQDLNTT
jgi:hypothetical protein